MEAYKILLAILGKPDAPKFYRNLRDHYKNNGFINESAALDHLIEKKFGKKDVNNDPDAGQKQ